MSNIRMVDLHTQYLRIKPEVDQAIQNVLTSTAFISGAEVATFSDKLRAYTRAGHVIPCANGTDALQIAFMALELRPGDEVIVPAHTFVSTAEAAAMLGLKPVFADVDPRTFNLRASDIESRITRSTRAIVPVHLYGQCADMEPILELARKHDLFVIEDAAQALGATCQLNGTWKSAGTMGLIGTTSFFPSKNLGCFGDGGAIFTNDARLGEKMQMIAHHGQRTKYKYEIVGVNSRLDTLQAAILNVKLKHIDEYTSRRSAAAAYYDRNLSGVDGIEIPYRAPHTTHTFHQYTLKAKNRDGLKAHLAGLGIPTMIYYPVPLHLQPAFHSAELGAGSFPVSEHLSETVISLPMHTELTEDQQALICKSIRTFYSR